MIDIDMLFVVPNGLQSLVVEPESKSPNAVREEDQLGFFM